MTDPQALSALPVCQLCGTPPVSAEHATETQRRWNALTHPPHAAFPAASPALDVRSAAFRKAVQAVFDAPGERYIDHFIDMLEARLASKEQG